MILYQIKMYDIVLDKNMKKYTSVLLLNKDRGFGKFTRSNDIMDWRRMEIVSQFRERERKRDRERERHGKKDYGCLLWSMSNPAYKR